MNINIFSILFFYLLFIEIITFYRRRRCRCRPLLSHSYPSPRPRHNHIYPYFNHKKWCGDFIHLFLHDSLNLKSQPPSLRSSAISTVGLGCHQRSRRRRVQKERERARGNMIIIERVASSSLSSWHAMTSIIGGDVILLISCLRLIGYRKMKEFQLLQIRHRHIHPMGHYPQYDGIIGAGVAWV